MLSLYFCTRLRPLHYDDVIMTMLASQITSLAVVYSIVYSGVNQRKHQSSASLAFVREIHRGPVNFPHKWPVTRKMFPFDDVIMTSWHANPLHITSSVRGCCHSGILITRVNKTEFWCFLILGPNKLSNNMHIVGDLKPQLIHDYMLVKLYFFDKQII